ncbi:hypothetical protein HID58_048907 [Brassica napus]|uniref:Replication protein A 70 kDa DNA-binding subunit B/D first OB fold domain-containing protein n=3 Tax=Brassica TaxID=3705 RepID=A0ABQ8B3F6_BRANA|nr:hypothetical protein HID58_048907 [Brassica napus]
MSTAMKVTPLKDVKPYKSGWKVHVKVLHSWKQYNPVHGDTLEIVLSDEAVSILIRSELQITNAFEASLLLINPDIAETAAFKQMFVDEVKPLAICEGRDEILDLEEVKSIQDKRDKWMLFPKRTIHGLLESTQNSVNLLDNEEHIDLSTPSTTPSTKRKGAWSDPPRDITSTSKNLRSKTIKVEKMSDLEAEAGKKT